MHMGNVAAFGRHWYFDELWVLIPRRNEDAMTKAYVLFQTVVDETSESAILGSEGKRTVIANMSSALPIMQSIWLSAYRGDDKI